MNNTELIKNWKYYSPKEPIGELHITRGQFMTGNMAGILISREIPDNSLNSIMNAKSFDFPVRYKVIDFKKGNIEIQIKQAISELEHEGCRFIATSGGRFAEFHKVISESTSLLALTSPLQALPLLSVSTSTDKKLIIVSSESEQAVMKALSNFGLEDIIDRCYILGYDKCIQARVCDLEHKGVRIGGIIWDNVNSDYYLRETHRFPVYSMVSMINLLKSVCAQIPYYGYI